MPKNSKQQKRVRVKPIPKRAKRKSELTRLGSALRALGGLGGSAIGSLVGMPTSGGAMGTGLGASLSRWLGSGDYEVSKNSIVTRLETTGSVPEMHKSDQSIIVRHREFVTTVNSAIGFTIQQSYDINPGNKLLFPWLSGIAARFQEYRIRGMVYHYVPTSGAAVASTNAALGAVMLQTSYRASDRAPASKVEMLNEYNSSESVPSEAFCHPVECDPKENPFQIQYVRSNATSTNEDKLLYDLGTTHVAVSGCQTSGNAIGDLWVTFEIELKKPIVSSNIITTSQSREVITSATSLSSLFSSVTFNAGNLPITLSGNTITFAKGVVGRFLVVLRLNTNFTTMSAWATPTIVGCNYTPGVLPANFVFTVVSSATALDGVTGILYCTIPDPATQATITFATPTSTGSLTGVFLSITPAED